MPVLRMNRSVPVVDEAVVDVPDIATLADRLPLAEETDEAEPLMPSVTMRVGNTGMPGPLQVLPERGI